MVEHAAVNRGVVGSSPTRGANFKTGRLSSENLFCVSGAYSSAVEPPAHNRLVPGSIPGGPTKSYGPLVKRLRHRPFTAVSGVRFPHGSPSSLSLGGYPGLFLLRAGVAVLRVE